MKTLLVLASAAIGMIAMGSAATYTYKAADAFRVGAFVKNSFTANGSESEGAIVVGGKFIANGNYDVNLRPDAETPYNVALAVGNLLSSTSSGKATIKIFGSRSEVDVVYGSLSSNAYQFIHNQTYSDQPIDTSSDPQKGVAAGTVDVSGAFNGLKNLSLAIDAKTGQSITYLNNQDQSTIANANGMAFIMNSANLVVDQAIMSTAFYLFDIDVADLNSGKSFDPKFFDADGKTTHQFSDSDKIVFNVVNLNSTSTSGGVDLTTLVKSFQGVGLAIADNILWNVSGDFNLKTGTEGAFFGSLLAPNSKFTNTLEFNGSLIVDTYVGTDKELHPVPFGGSTPSVGLLSSPAPEPGSALAGILLALGLMRRQRR